jgi:hypothetical protein
MYGRQFQQPTAGGFGLSGPVPRDVVVLLAVVLATFSLQFFDATRGLHQLLILTPGVWRSGMLWQLATYLFAGVGAPSFWFLLSLLILFLFARTVFFQLGRRAFWKWLLTVGVASALIAALAGIVTGSPERPSTMFVLMQGQYMLITVIIAAFATMNRDATILLFFVLPVQAKWFLLLELLFAFMGFLSTHDLAGFLGLCAGVGLTFAYLSAGSPVGQLRRWWLQAQEQWIRFRLRSMRKKRNIRLVDEKDEDDRWVH